MALEIARVVPKGSTVLDVGCGNGFIAHHLSGILNSTVVGLDVDRSSKSHITYLTYDGRHFPVADQTFDAVLLCYVLHHAQDARLVLDEVRRVLKDGGVTVVYEDNPSGLFDRAVCWTHNVQWKSRTGPCTFQLESEWRKLFRLAGFTIITQRELSRWRNIAHPVARNFFVLQAAQVQLKPLDHFVSDPVQIHYKQNSQLEPHCHDVTITQQMPTSTASFSGLAGNLTSCRLLRRFILKHV
jgi:SAM-dependent methyltransferase